MRKKRVGIITGASSGLGMHYALQAADFYPLEELWLFSRRGEKMKRMAAHLSVPCRLFPGDLSEESPYSALKEALIDSDVVITLLINCAGYGISGEFAKNDLTEQLGMIDVNCASLVKMTYLCLPFMKKGSRILQVASAAAFCPQPMFAVYAATKSFVYSFSLALARELKRQGICMTVVCPGPVDTAFFDRCLIPLGSTRKHLRAKPAHVVRKSMEDSLKGKNVSVYQTSMSLCRVLTKCVPYHLCAAVMHRVNQS